VAGILIMLFGWTAADSLISVFIGLLIVWSSWHLIRDATNVLLEGTPAHINLAAVEEAILETDGVSDVHDLHVWTITSGREALSAHVIHAYSISQPILLQELRAKLLDRFGVDHLTIQMETADFEDEAISFLSCGHGVFSIGTRVVIQSAPGCARTARKMRALLSYANHRTRLRTFRG